LDDRNLIRETATDASAYERKLVQEGEKVMVETLEDEGMDVTILSHAQVARFRKLSESIDQFYSVPIGPAVVQQVRNP